MQIKVASLLCQISMAKLYWTFGEAARKVGLSVLSYIVSAGLTLLLLKLFGPPPPRICTLLKAIKPGMTHIVSFRNAVSIEHTALYCISVCCFLVSFPV